MTKNEKMSAKGVLDEFRSFSKEELQLKINSIKQELMKIRFLVKTDPNKVNLAFKVRGLKKTVARVNTVLREKELMKSSL